MPDTDQPETHEPQPLWTSERSDVPGEEMTALILPSPPRFTMRAIFVGREGLRAGWGLLIFIALLITLGYSTGRLVHAVVHHGDAAKSSAAAQSGPQSSKPTAPAPPELAPANRVLIGEGISVFAVVVATWLMAKIERRPNSTYGLGGRRRSVNFLSGLGWGVAMLSLLVISLRACGLLVFDARLLFGGSAFRYGLVWFAGFMLVGLFEEYLFRGYLQFTLARGINGIYDWLRSFGTGANGQKWNGQQALGFWIAAALVSFGFGFVHRSNPGESPIGLLSAALVAVVFCLSLWRTGSLWWAIGFHAAWDWAQSFLYGVADSGLVIQGHLFSTHPVGRPVFSGGLTGPEGSLFILPILGMTAAVIVLTLRRERFVGVAANTPEPALD